jgi:hypothetical protein
MVGQVLVKEKYTPERGAGSAAATVRMELIPQVRADEQAESWKHVAQENQIANYAAEAAIRFKG